MGTAKYTFNLKAGNWFINPTVGLEWLSNEVVDHHFGVSAPEANTMRAAYSGSNAINLFAGVRARYEINDHWDFSASTGVNWLDSTISDSSVVDANHGYNGAISVNYNF